MNIESHNNKGLTLGRLSATSQGLDVITQVSGKAQATVAPPKGNGAPFDMNAALLTVLSGSGGTLPGWPSSNPIGLAGGQAFPETYGHTVAADLDGDGLDEAINTWVYKADGSLAPDWAKIEIYSPAIGDLDNDGRPEVVETIGGGEPVTVYRYNGTPMTEFTSPKLPKGIETIMRLPVIGDVDGDGVPEVIDVVHIGQPSPEPPPGMSALAIQIISAKGALKRTIPFTGVLGDFVTLALTDFDHDGAAEILAQTADKLFIWKGDGSALAGWPQDTTFAVSPFVPVIGDVDGDAQPDVITIARPPTSADVELRAYNWHGRLLPHFPKLLPLGPKADIAIADVDNDGRNEIIVSSVGTMSEDNSSQDKLWIFDLHGKGKYGPVEWGQYAGGPQHQGFYKPGR